jgi:hypothetical protein
LGAPSPASRNGGCIAGALSLSALGLVGCGTRGAPWFSLFGAYFPAWLLCGLIGVVGAVIVRVIAVAAGVDAVVRFRLLTYGALGVLLALGTWKLGFGP